MSCIRKQNTQDEKNSDFNPCQILARQIWKRVHKLLFQIKKRHRTAAGATATTTVTVTETVPVTQQQQQEQHQHQHQQQQ